MSYIENIWICLAAPMIIGQFLLEGETKSFLRFFLIGTLVCLFSSYCNSFIAGISGMELVEVTSKLTPMLEELLKALPLLFYMVVFSPTGKQCIRAALALGLGVATLENCCYVLGNGAENLSFVLMRGFSSGVLHTLCAALLGVALALLLRHKDILWYGVFCALCLCSTYHAIYNLMVTATGYWQVVGHCLPFATAVIVIFAVKYARHTTYKT